MLCIYTLIVAYWSYDQQSECVVFHQIWPRWYLLFVFVLFDLWIIFFSQNYLLYFVTCSCSSCISIFNHHVEWICETHVHNLYVYHCFSNYVETDLEVMCMIIAISSFLSGSCFFLQENLEILCFRVLFSFMIKYQHTINHVPASMSWCSSCCPLKVF